MVLGVSRSRLLDAGLVAAVALAGLAVLVWSPTPDGYREPTVFAAVPRRRVGDVVVVVAHRASSPRCSEPAPSSSSTSSPAIRSASRSTPHSSRLRGLRVRISPSRWIAIAAIAVTVATYAVADRGPLDVGIFVAISIATIVAGLLGDSTRTRRELNDAEEREREALQERVVLEERARLARELHDSLGHAVNVMVMQAGVGRHVFDERPDFARQALEQVESVGRAALGELDAVLRVLRPTDAEQRAEPETTNLSGLEALCDRIRAAGREVDLEVEEVDLVTHRRRAPTASCRKHRRTQPVTAPAARLQCR